jgi:H/ACA ribonucleoprotein complex non-core subunit NAF1
MAEKPFKIPGLGQGKHNEQLPVENFAPDLLTAAASIMGENGVAWGGSTNENTQWVMNQRQQQQEKEAENTSTAATAATAATASQPKGDDMKIDSKINPTTTSDPSPADDPDVDMPSEQSSTIGRSVAEDDAKTISVPSSPSVTHALEAAINGILSSTSQNGVNLQQQNTIHPEQETKNPDQELNSLSAVAGAEESAMENPEMSDDRSQQDDAHVEQENGHPEWEVDSSPYESSSESSSDSSSDEDSEDEGGYELLGIEETARLLMATDGDGEGDGDGTGKAKNSVSVLRTKNEVPDEVMPKPDVTITPDMKIELLGHIMAVVENTIVIQSQGTGEYQVLDSGSVLCKEDRTVIGALAEILGNVRSPMYTVGFPTEEEIGELGLAVGTPIFFSVEHANYVFTQALKEAKGTDASNLHDEEVAADEMEFSDDEKEAEYKRQQKLKKRGGKNGRGGRDQHGQRRASNSTELTNMASGAGLNYDDDDDGPYKPLTRPPGFGQSNSASLPPMPPRPEARSSASPRYGHREAHRGGRGDFRGRGGRGGYRGGDRRQAPKGGRGGSHHQFGYDGASSPPAAFSNLQSPPIPNPHLPPPPFGAKPLTTSGQWPAAPSSYGHNAAPYQHSPPAGPPMRPPQQGPSGNFTFNYQARNQNQGQQHQYPQAAPLPPAIPFQQPLQPSGYAQPFSPAWPVAETTRQAPPAAGSYNPALYGGYQHGQQAQAQQGQQQYWPPQHGAYGQGPNQQR